MIAICRACLLVAQRGYHCWMIAAAYLRVYVREDRLARKRWEEHGSGSIRKVVVTDHFLWTESTADDVLVLEWEGDRFVCPRFARLRMLEGVIAFDKTYPGGVLIPKHAVETVKDQLIALRSQMPSAKSHILTSPWFVPLRWFVAFTAEHRSLYQAGSGMSLRYRAPMDTVKRRVDRGIRVLSDANLGPGALVPLQDLARWLAGFTEDAVVELDYDRVAGMFSEADLVLDDSSALVEESIVALEAGDFLTAGLRYREVASRWAPSQAQAFLN